MKTAVFVLNNLDVRFSALHANTETVEDREKLIDKVSELIAFKRLASIEAGEDNTPTSYNLGDIHREQGTEGDDTIIPERESGG